MVMVTSFSMVMGRTSRCKELGQQKYFWHPALVNQEALALNARSIALWELHSRNIFRKGGRNIFGVSRVLTGKIAGTSRA